MSIITWQGIVACARKKCEGPLSLARSLKDLQVPGMASFRPDYSSGQPLHQQWCIHLQRQAYVDDVTSSVRDVTTAVDSVERAISASVDAYNRRATELTSAVAAASSQHEAGVNATIAAIGAGAASVVGAVRVQTASIERFGMLLDNNLTMLVDQQRVSNVIAANIARLMAVPDFQKERLYYLEQGLKHYQNAAIDPSLMDNALEDLLRAEEREKTDYVVLHRLGMIYLYSAAHADAEKALAYFMRAAKFAAVESSPGAIRLAQLLTGVADQPLNQQIPGTTSARRLAAESFLEAAFAEYLLGNYAEALAQVRRAEAFAPARIDLRVAEAKYLFLCDSPSEAVTVLSGVIEKDRIYAAIVATDPELDQRPECLELLRNLRKDARDRVTSLIESADASGAPFVAPGGSLFPHLFVMRTVARDGSFLDALGVLDEWSADAEAQLSAWGTIAKQVATMSAIETSDPIVIAELRFYNDVLRSSEYNRFKEMLTSHCGEPDISSIDIASLVAQRVESVRLARIAQDNQRRLEEKFEAERVATSRRQQIAREEKMRLEQEARSFYDAAICEIKSQRKRMFTKNFDYAATLLRKAVDRQYHPAIAVLDWIERPMVNRWCLEDVVPELRNEW